MMISDFESQSRSTRPDVVTLALITIKTELRGIAPFDSKRIFLPR
jgi:hypothetical protein